MPSDFTSCSSGMDFSPPQNHVFLNTRSLSRSLPAIDDECSAHDIGDPEVAFSKSENFIRHFLSKSRSKPLSFPYVAPMI